MVKEMKKLLGFGCSNLIQVKTHLYFIVLFEQNKYLTVVGAKK